MDDAMLPLCWMESCKEELWLQTPGTVFAGCMWPPGTWWWLKRRRSCVGSVVPKIIRDDEEADTGVGDRYDQ